MRIVAGSFALGLAATLACGATDPSSEDFALAPGTAASIATDAAIYTR